MPCGHGAFWGPLSHGCLAAAGGRFGHGLLVQGKPATALRTIDNATPSRFSSSGLLPRPSANRRDGSAGNRSSGQGKPPSALSGMTPTAPRDLSGPNVYALGTPNLQRFRRPGDAHTLASKPCGMPTKAMISPQIRNRTLYFHYAFGFPFPMTRIHVRLLGPCYKTGQADHACIRLQSMNRAKQLVPTICLAQ